MKKPTAKQLAARKKFAYIMKHGGFKKSKKVGAKQQRRKLRKAVHKKLGLSELARRRNTVLQESKRTNKKARKRIDELQGLAQRLRKMLNDPSVKEVVFRK